MKTRKISSRELAKTPTGIRGVDDDMRYVLRLYISGSTPRSACASRNLKRMCEARLQGRYQLAVIDIYQQPGLAQNDQTVATPTLIKEEPAPRPVLVGDFSGDDRVLAALSLAPPPAAS